MNRETTRPIPEPARRCLSLLLLALFVLGCGGVSRSYLVEQRPAEEAGEYIEAVARAARARGYDVRTAEDQVARFVFDADQGAVIAYQVRRNGLLLVVKIDEERVPPTEQDAAFARAEQAGRELMAEARVIHAELAQAREREAALQAERERREAAVEAERDRQNAAEREQQRAALADFMANNRERSRANAVGNDEPVDASEPGSSGGRGSQGSSAHCCVNGAFYDCPSAAAVDQCVGRFTRCISGCGMSCMEQCLQTDPPDPSSCERQPSRDGEC